MHIYAVINQKGGIGKTTTAAALAAGLSAKGHKTLLIDLDAQCSLTFTLRAINSSPTIYDILTGTAGADEAIYHSEQGDIIPSSEAMAAIDKAVPEARKEYRLKEAISSLKAKYDYIIIDTPPALSTATTNALTAADSVIIPAQADAYSMQGIGQLYNTINTVKTYCNNSLYIDGILLTAFESNTTLSRLIEEQAREAAELMGTKLYKTKIRKCGGIKEAQACQINIYDYKPRAKVKNAVADYTAFIDELLQRSMQNRAKK